MVEALTPMEVFPKNDLRSYQSHGSNIKTSPSETELRNRRGSQHIEHSDEVVPGNSPGSPLQPLRLLTVVEKKLLTMVIQWCFSCWDILS